MDIRRAVDNFLDDYESLCVKHGVIILGVDADETNFSKGLKFSSISKDGGIRIETEVFKAHDVFSGIREAFR